MNRFFAFWWALGGVLVFGVLIFLVAAANSTGGDGGAGEFEANRAAERSAKLAVVRDAQAKLLSGAGEAVEGSAGKIRVPLEVAAEMVLKEAGSGVPRVTAVPVPGTPAALELMKKQAAEQAPAKPEEPAAKPAPTPAPTPAAKPQAKPEAKKAPAKKAGAKGAKKGAAAAKSEPKPKTGE